MDVYLPQPKEQRRRRSMVGRIWRGTKMAARGPVEAAATAEITRGASLIGALFKLLQRGPAQDKSVQLDEHGVINVRATAYLLGITPDELEERLQQRQRQTGRAAYALSCLGALSFTCWIYGALQMTMSAARVISAVEFLPFCVLFGLLAFKSSWMNWQLRTRTLGSALAYLRTTDAFLPR